MNAFPIVSRTHAKGKKPAGRRRCIALKRQRVNSVQTTHWRAAVAFFDQLMLALLALTCDFSTIENFVGGCPDGVRRVCASTSLTYS